MFFILRPFFYLLIQNKLNFFDFLPRKIRRNLKKYFRLFTSPLRIFPDFLIVGAAKSGTSSLYNYLIKHPCVIPALRKEVHYFGRNFDKKILWYKSFFPTIIFKYINGFIYKREVLTGEASTYYMFHPHAPKRIFSIIPNVKIIILLRNPVNRAFSHYQNLLRRGIIKLPFVEVIKKELDNSHLEKNKMLRDENYNSEFFRIYSNLARGVYIQQIRNLRKYFHEKQILIIKSENFFDNPDKILRKVYKFLKLPYFKIKEFKKYNVGNYVEMDVKIREFLKNYFKPYNKQLYEYLVRDFKWEN